MNALEKPTNWTADQIEYQEFLATGKRDENGVKRTKEWFAKNVIQGDVSKLYDWQRLPGWDEAVLDRVPSRLVQFVPELDQVQLEKARKGDNESYRMILARIGRPIVTRQRIESKQEVELHHNPFAGLSDEEVDERLDRLYELRKERREGAQT